jgi:pimeloyl-[acyl-carrier protein] methyl ester esterase
MAYFTSHDGCRIHFTDNGNGHPLVLVHGWAMSSRVWQFQAVKLSSSCRVVTVDLRGHGLSEPPPSGTLKLADMSSDLVTLFERLNLERAVLAGWSLGSQVVLGAFSALRERLAGVVLVGGTPRFTVCDGYEHGLPAKEVRGMLLRLKRDYSGTMGDFFRRMFAEGELSREQNQRMVQEIVIPARQPLPDVALQGLEILAEADLRTILPQINRPVLLLYGSEDTICLPSASGYMAERIPGAASEAFAGCGHAPFISRPEQFNRVLMKFLERVHATD